MLTGGLNKKELYKYEETVFLLLIVNFFVPV